MKIPFTLKGRYSDAEMIEKLSKGNRVAEDYFYERTLPIFVSSIVKSIKLDEGFVREFIYDNSVFEISYMRLLDIIQKKNLIVRKKEVFYIKQSGEESKVESLEKMIVSIGVNVFREIKHTEDAVHGMHKETESELADRLEAETILGIESSGKRKWVVSGGKTGDDADIIGDDDSYTDNPDTFAEAAEPKKVVYDKIVWEIINEMKSPCLEIFEETFSKDVTNSDDKKIAKKLGYKNSESLKNQRSRCIKKFETVLKSRYSREEIFSE